MVRLVKTFSRLVKKFFFYIKAYQIPEETSLRSFFKSGKSIFLTDFWIILYMVTSTVQKMKSLSPPHVVD